MNFLEERIIKDGIVKEGNVLKVDSFLNHQMDIKLFDMMGAEFKKRFAGEKITKILTIEASGIGIACVAAQHFNVPVAVSYTHLDVYKRQPKESMIIFGIEYLKREKEAQAASTSYAAAQPCNLLAMTVL